ncbi:MAG TPA: cytochrome c [Bryobacteraceae bacterium]|nr:cytochrome c [Bryobacteraceae bacterium]
MKRNIVLAGFVMLGMVAFSSAAVDQQFQGYMKKMVATSGQARKDVAAKDNAAVEKDAKNLQGIYKDVASYFSKHNMSDAETVAKNGETASKELASAAKDGSTEKMEADMKTINGTCGTCHMAHRAKAADGTFEIK